MHVPEGWVATQSPIPIALMGVHVDVSTEELSAFNLYVEDSFKDDFFDIEELQSLVSAGESSASSISSVSTLSCPAGCVYTWTTVSSAS